VTPEIAKLLREPFPSEVVGKLPRVWCKRCRDAAKAGRTCDDHTKVRCQQCRNNITTAHLHLDYVGHAETTDRFLMADPDWTWEPLAFAADGLPAFDRYGGLWIRLTIAGTSRLGYGAAEGKEGPDAVKEIIGDALRNAGMRFGVALDLWGAKFKDSTEEQHDDDAASQRPARDVWNDARPAQPAIPPETARLNILANARVAIADAGTLAVLDQIEQRLQGAYGRGQITDQDANDLTDAVIKRREVLDAARPEPEPLP